MKIISKIRTLSIGVGMMLILSTATPAYSQIVTLTELTKEYDIENIISLEISGSYKLNTPESIDKAVKAVVTNRLETPVQKIQLTVLLSKNLQSLEQHIESMGKGGEYVKADNFAYTYTEEEFSGARAQDEQFVSFNQPIVKHNNANKKKKEARIKGTIVDTLYNGPIPMPAKNSIDILKGKNITLNQGVKTGIYHLAIVLSYPDSSGIFFSPRITKMHYLSVSNERKTPLNNTKTPTDNTKTP